jgi:EamA domain-containing membrane protein RarD
MTTLPGHRPYPPSTRQRQRLGTVALTLGLIAVPLAVLCGLGALSALAGLGFGVYAAVQDRGRRHAVLGIVASLLALVIACVVVGWFLAKAAKCGDVRRYPGHAARVQCVEHEFPMVHRPGAGHL